MPSPHPTVAQLVAMDTLKTWSLIATLFGDLDGEELSGTDIRNLLCHIGIKPEAIRVALHRLKSDGWIISSRKGREAVYRMSKAARAETDAVAPYIYRLSPEPLGAWQIRLYRETPASKDAIIINRNLAVVRSEADTSDPDALSLTPQESRIPTWVQEILVSGHLMRLAQELKPLVASYSDLSQTLDRLAFRLLALHHWRRIALRPGSRAHASLLPEGPIAQCQVEIAGFLAKAGKITRQSCQIKEQEPQGESQS